MHKSIILSALLIVLSSQAFGDRVKLGKKDLELFRPELVLNEEAACNLVKDDPKKFALWLQSEIKNTSELDGALASVTKLAWDSEIQTFKVGEDSVEGIWQMGSPGTFGKINGNKFKLGNQNDGTSIKAVVIDVGDGSLNALKGRDDLGNKIWLVEQSNLVPSLVALSLEAKIHKALGLLVYGADHANLDSPDAQAVLPVLRVSSTLANRLKTKVDGASVQVEMAIRTEFPVKKEENITYVKKGIRDVTIGLLANRSDCGAIATLLALMDWLKNSKVPVQGTLFEFGTTDFDSQKGLVASVLNVYPKEFDPKKFITAWLKADQDLSDLIDVKSVLKRAQHDTSDLQGLVDNEDLKQFKTQLKQIESLAKGRPEVALQLKRIFEEDQLSALAQSLKNLKQVHDFAQRGQWDKAVTQLKKLGDYQWADNVSVPAFIEYEKSVQPTKLTVDPALWTEIQKGRDHLDGFIEAVEVEIDRLDKRLADNFFKVHKSIENLDKI